MIKIERANLKVIADNYLNKLLQVKKYNNKKGNVIQNYWITHKDRIIISKDLDGIINEFKKLNQNGLDKFSDYMIGQYEELFYNHKIGKWLAEQLDIKTCPYCNRQYTFTIESEDGTKSIRPEFDHFHSKSDFPFLALSFYNLIPACPTCNHTKSNNPIDINPYYEGFEDYYKFKVLTKNNREDSLDWLLKEEMEIDFTNSNKNIKEFALKELYNEHLDYVKEIIDKVQAYNQTYYTSLIDTYKGLGKQEAEIDRFIWGNYLDNTEHEKRGLAKLTKDILQQLKIK